MKYLERVRLILLTPWLIVRWLKVWRAWERNNWPHMVVLLQGILASGLESNGEHILLGVAFARQGQLTEALRNFERVNRRELMVAEKPVFYNEYAYTLACAGRTADAEALLRAAPLDRFPEPQRRWARDFATSLGDAEPPPLEGLKAPRVLH